MRLFNKVAIVGVGLIGGSVAMALKKKGLTGQILGVSRHKETIQIAKKNKTIDKGSQDFKIIKDADLVILATPVNTIIKSARFIANFIKPGCIVTDVGSTKKEIVSRLEKIYPNYVGSHPLAGSEKRGILNAHPEMFKDSLCVLTPTKKTNQQALKKIKTLWNKVGSRVLFLTPEDHDKIISFVSHLPHIVAFSLIKSIPTPYFKLSATSLKSTTRIVLSDSQLWTDIFLTNPRNILKTIDLFQANLTKIKSAISKKDRRQLIKILKEAKRKRELLR